MYLYYTYIYCLQLVGRLIVCRTVHPALRTAAGLELTVEKWFLKTKKSFQENTNINKSVHFVT